MRLAAPIALVLVLLLVAFTADRPRPRADFVFAQRSDCFTLDPQRMSYQQDFRMARAIYECLVVLDPQDVSIEPGVAERWEVSEDGRVYTFHLRENARWSNGDPVRSGDFVYAWRRALLPETVADYSGLLFTIDGAREFFEWRQAATAEYAARPSDAKSPAAAEELWKATERRFSGLVGLSTPDEHSLVVRLAQPVAYFLHLAAFPALSPVHPPTVERFVLADAETGALIQRHGWTKPGNLVSNGPYRVAEWRYKRDMLLERNEHYWNRAAVRAATVQAVVLEDANTTVLAADSGAVDWVTDVVVEYRADMLNERARYEDRYRDRIERAERDGATRDEALASLPAPGEGERRNVHALSAFGTDFFSFNCRPTLRVGDAPNPFADPRVRRAFAMAVDKRTLVSRVTRLNEPVSNVLVPPGSIDGYESPAGLPYDPDRARATLAEAGWKDRDGDGLVENASGERFPTVDLLYPTGSPRYRDLSLALGDMWRRELGVEMQPRAKDPKMYKEDLKGGNFMIARGTWYGDYGDPTTFLDLSRSTDGNNDRKFDDPAYDAMLDAAATETDPAKRFAILSDAERYMLEEGAPLVPICTILTIYMYEPGEVVGVTHHPQLDQYLGQIEHTVGRAGLRLASPQGTRSAQ